MLHRYSCQVRILPPLLIAEKGLAVTRVLSLLAENLAAVQNRPRLLRPVLARPQAEALPGQRQFPNRQAKAPRLRERPGERGRLPAADGDSDRGRAHRLR